MSQRPPSKMKQLLRWLPGVVISAIAIYALIRFSSFQGIQSAFRSVKMTYLLLLAVLLSGSLFVRAVAWRTILGNQINLQTAFFGVSEGYFLNNIFPFRLGEIGRAVFVGRSSGLGVFYVLSTVFIERAFDILYAGGIVLLTIPLIAGSAWIKPVALTALIVIAASLILLFLLAVKREKITGWVETRKTQTGLFSSYVIPQVHKLLEGMKALTSPKLFVLSLFWVGMTWLIWMFLYYSAVIQVAPGAPFYWGMLVSGVLALGVAIPSAPAALGVFEASFVGAFLILGISNDAVLVYAIVIHAAQFIISGIFGIWGIIREGISFSNLLNTILVRKSSSQISN